MSTDKRIRVVHVITRLVRGGAQRVMLDTLKHLDRERFEPIVAAGPETGAEGSLWDEADTLDIPVHRLKHMGREISALRDLKAYHELRRLFKELRPEVVHSHTSKAGLLGSAAARKCRVPGVIYAPHGHIFGNGAKIPGVPERGLKRKLLYKAARHSARCARMVVTPNAIEREDGIELGLWTAEKCVAVNNGIDTHRFQPRDRREARQELRLPQDGVLFGVAARLTSEKGADLAIRAISEVAKGRLVVLGDGPDRSELEALIQELGLKDRVLLMGFNEDIAAAMPAFDVLVVPSRYEAHGLVAAEAMSCGIPVIASDVGGLPSMVKEGETGWCFEPENAGQLTTIMRRIIEGERPALDPAGLRSFICDNFSTNSMVRSLEAIYQQLHEKGEA